MFLVVFWQHSEPNCPPLPVYRIGLKQAVETVNDYNPLMKDFPLNDLLSASELDKIRQALMAIFTHLKKIRNTKYPIQRALRLVEAISRDLSSQLLKVLGTRKLMHVAYEEFEKVGNVTIKGEIKLRCNFSLEVDSLDTLQCNFTSSFSMHLQVLSSCLCRLWWHALKCSKPGRMSTRSCRCF